LQTRRRGVKAQKQTLLCGVQKPEKEEEETPKNPPWEKACGRQDNSYVERGLESPCTENHLTTHGGEGEHDVDKKSLSNRRGKDLGINRDFGEEKGGGASCLPEKRLGRNISVHQFSSWEWGKGIWFGGDRKLSFPGHLDRESYITTKRKLIIDNAKQENQRQRVRRTRRGV